MGKWQGVLHGGDHDGLVVDIKGFYIPHTFLVPGQACIYNAPGGGVLVEGGSPPDKKRDWLEYSLCVYDRVTYEDCGSNIDYRYSGDNTVTRCEAVTQKGGRCRHESVSGSAYCGVHSAKVWTPETISILTESWGVVSPTEIAEMINSHNLGVDNFRECSWEWVVKKACAVGLISATDRDKITRPTYAESKRKKNLQRQIDGYIHPQVREFVMKRDCRCLACGSTEDLAIDHIVPVKMGGGGEARNLQVLCRSCNSSKGAQMIDYRPSLGANRNDSCPCGSGRKYKHCCMPYGRK